MRNTAVLLIVMSLDLASDLAAGQASQVSSDARQAILDYPLTLPHALTAQDYLVGVPTLRMALMVAQGLPTGPNIIASPANVAFAKTNLTELKPKMDAADGIRR